MGCNPLLCQGPDPPACCDQGEDFGRRDDDVRWAAPRLLVRIRASEDVVWGWRPLSAEGCTNPFETDLASVSVEYLPWSHWSDRGTSIIGFNCDNSQEPTRCAFRSHTLQDVPLDGSGLTRVSVTDPDGPGPLLALNSLMWTTSFAEERLPLWSDIVSYVVSLNDGPTSANANIGGQPTANYNQRSDRKFIIAHEYGHVQTLLQPALIMGEMFDGSDVDYSFMTPGVNQHTLFSPEWQSAAALEGFAQYYALLVWWDQTTPVAKLLSPAMIDGEIRREADTELRRIIDTACLQFDLEQCPPGVTNEVDWMAALWQFSLVASEPTNVLRLLALAFMWPINGESDAYWIHFTDSIASALTPAELETFLTIAAQAGIDR